MRLMFVAGTLLLLSMKEPNGRSDTVAVFFLYCGGAPAISLSRSSI